MLLLTGCFGGEPSEQEARAALLDAESPDHRHLLEEFKLAGCKAAAGAPGYQCDFTYRLPTGPARTASGRFFKANDKWVFEASRR